MAKSPWLQEVEDDAVRITLERVKTFKEEQARKDAKAEAEAAKVAKVEAVKKPVVEELEAPKVSEPKVEVGTPTRPLYVKEERITKESR